MFVARKGKRQTTTAKRKKTLRSGADAPRSSNSNGVSQSLLASQSVAGGACPVPYGAIEYLRRAKYFAFRRAAASCDA